MFSRLLSLFHRCWSAFLLISAFSVYCAAQQPRSVIPSALELADPFGSGWALGDLDGDHETDIALSWDVGQSGSGHVYRVELKLSQPEGAGSFIFTDSDGLGVNIAAVDVDGDHDLDLVISRRLSLQRIGVWINNGKGSFTQSLYTFYSATADPSLHAIRLYAPTQAIDENASQRLGAYVPQAGLVPEDSLSIRAECGTELGCTFRFVNGPLRPRAPPTASSILVPI